MKMFRLEHETMHVCQTNVARFDHVVCRFLEIEGTFSGLRQGRDSFICSTLYSYIRITDMSELVQIKVIYDYYSSKRITPFS